MTYSVAVLTPAWLDWDLQLLRGIQHFASTQGGWDVQYFAQPKGLNLDDLRHVHCDGVIAMGQNADDAARIQHLDAPLVYVFDAPPNTRRCLVRFDESAIGRLGARHLLGCGFTRMGFVGVDNPRIRRREAAFVQSVEQAGASVLLAIPPAQPGLRHDWRPDWSTAEDTLYLRDFLQRLQPPAAVMCAHDRQAQRLINQVRLAGLDVPNDIAVLSVDDYALYCAYQPVPISSVNPNLQDMGYQAAHLLVGGASRQRLLIEPTEVVQRASTNTRASDDPVLRDAFARLRSTDAPASVSQLAARCNVSRRTLETRFRKTLGQSPAQHMLDLRLRRARSLLTETEMPLRQVAKLCGFAHLSHFSNAFFRAYRQRPAAYRRQHPRPAHLLGLMPYTHPG